MIQFRYHWNSKTNEFEKESNKYYSDYAATDVVSSVTLSNSSTYGKHKVLYEGSEIELLFLRFYTGYASHDFDFLIWDSKISEDMAHDIANTYCLN